MTFFPFPNYDQNLTLPYPIQFQVFNKQIAKRIKAQKVMVPDFCWSAAPEK